MEGVTIEIIGLWIWLSGNTYAYKDEIKEMGFLWSSSHKMWFYNGDSRKTHKFGKKNINDLRNTWGSSIVGTGHAAKEAALE